MMRAITGADLKGSEMKSNQAYSLKYSSPFYGHLMLLVLCLSIFVLSVHCSVDGVVYSLHSSDDCSYFADKDFKLE